MIVMVFIPKLIDLSLPVTTDFIRLFPDLTTSDQISIYHMTLYTSSDINMKLKLVLTSLVSVC